MNRTITTFISAMLLMPLSYAEPSKFDQLYDKNINTCFNIQYNPYIDNVFVKSVQFTGIDSCTAELVPMARDCQSKIKDAKTAMSKLSTIGFNRFIINEKTITGIIKEEDVCTTK